MKLIKKLSNAEVKPFGQLFIVGVILVVLGLATDLSESEGANIGGGLLLGLGLLTLLVGATGIAIKTDSLTIRLVVGLVIVLGIFGVTSSWQAAEDKSNRLYCEEKQQTGEAIVEGPEFCEPYLN